MGDRPGLRTPPAPEDRWASFLEQQDVAFESPDLTALMQPKEGAGGQVAGEGRPSLLLGVSFTLKAALGHDTGVTRPAAAWGCPRDHPVHFLT